MQSVKKCFILFVKRLLSYIYYGKLSNLFLHSGFSHHDLTLPRGQVVVYSALSTVFSLKKILSNERNTDLSYFMLKYFCFIVQNLLFSQCIFKLFVNYGYMCLCMMYECYIISLDSFFIIHESDSHLYDCMNTSHECVSESDSHL